MKYNYIKGYEKVIETFGYFPTFHDDKLINYVIKKQEITLTIRTVQNNMNSWKEKDVHEVITKLKFTNYENLKYQFNKKERYIIGIEFGKTDTKINVSVTGINTNATNFGFVCDEVEVVSCKGYSHHRGFQSIIELYKSIQLFLEDKVEIEDQTIEIKIHNDFIAKITGGVYYRIMINNVLFLDKVEDQDIWYFIKEMVDDDRYIYVQYKEQKRLIFKKKATVIDHLKDKVDINKLKSDKMIDKIFDAKSIIC